MSKATTLSQLELHALKSANYTDKKVSELGETVAKTLSEMSLSADTDEIVISSSEPTDERVKVWINPDEEEEEPEIAGKVQTDWNQTDESKPDALLNRPFGYYPTGSDTLTWDGNIEGRDVLYEVLYKVSDAIPTIEDFANGYKFTINNAGEVVSIDAASDWVVESAGLIFLQAPDDILPYVVVVPAEAADEEGVSPGVYFLNADMTVLGGQGFLMTTQITIPGYGKFEYNRTIEKQYLPPIDAGNLQFPVFYIKEIGDRYIYKGSACDTKADKTDIANLQLFVLAVVSESYGVVGRMYPLSIDTRGTYCVVGVSNNSSYYTSEYEGT